MDDDLRVRLLLRKKFLMEVVRFGEDFIVKHGTKVSLPGNSDYTAMWRLANFEEFSFFAVFGETQFGGNTFRVWYHPGSEKADKDVGRFYQGEDFALDFYHQDVGIDLDNTNDWEVKFFDQRAEWQKAIRWIMKNAYRILAARERAKTEAAAKEQGEQAARADEVRLAQEAVRLGVR